MPLSTRRIFRDVLKPGAAMLLPGVANALAVERRVDRHFIAAQWIDAVGLMRAAVKRAVAAGILDVVHDQIVVAAGFSHCRCSLREAEFSAN